MTIIFFRDDDVGSLTDQFGQVVDLFLRRHIPVNYQVIPKFLAREAANLMISLHSSQPDLIKINQHGYKHEQYIDGIRHWSEFSGGRAYNDQLADIKKGRSILDDMLGSAFSKSVFTPPQHKYDYNTLRALDHLEYKILSCSYYPAVVPLLAYHLGGFAKCTTILGRGVSYHSRKRPDSGLLEISVSIFLDDAQRIIKTASSFMKDFKRARKYTPVVGIGLHHKVFVGSTEIAILDELLEMLTQLPGLQFGTIEQIADDFSACRDGTRNLAAFDTHPLSSGRDQ